MGELNERIKAELREYKPPCLEALTIDNHFMNIFQGLKLLTF
jgi:hypothetical protein